MSSAEYYDNFGYPAFGSPGSSAPMRGEFQKIENGFSKMPDLAGNANEIVKIKADASGMETVGTVGSGNVVLAPGVTGTGNAVLQTDPTFILSDTTTNNVSTSQHGWVPKLPGNTTTFLRGDGNFAAPPTASLPSNQRSSNTIFGSADTSTIVEYTSGTFTQTFTAAATLNSGWFIWLKNAGTGDITLDPNGAELIDGLASFVMYPGEVRLVSCTGTGFRSCVANGFSKIFTANDNFIKAPGYAYFEGELYGAGASGANSGAAATGASGGGGGACVPFKLAASAFAASTAVTLGVGGTGVAAGNSGNAGGNSTLGALLTAYGGGPGFQGGAGAAISGGSGGGAISAGSIGTTGTSTGGAPGDAITASDGLGGAGGTATTSGAGRSSGWGGAAGGGSGTTGDAGQQGGNSVHGGAGGGGAGTASAAGGTSVFGGAGGAGSNSGNGVAGTAPAGGGGATKTGGSSGAGARGELRIRGVA